MKILLRILTISLLIAVFSQSVYAMTLENIASLNSTFDVNFTVKQIESLSKNDRSELEVIAKKLYLVSPQREIDRKEALKVIGKTAEALTPTDPLLYGIETALESLAEKAGTVVTIAEIGQAAGLAYVLYKILEENYNMPGGAQGVAGFTRDYISERNRGESHEEAWEKWFLFYTGIYKKNANPKLEEKVKNTFEAYQLTLKGEEWKAVRNTVILPIFERAKKNDEQQGGFFSNLWQEIKNAVVNVAVNVKEFFVNIVSQKKDTTIQPSDLSGQVSKPPSEPTDTEAPKDSGQQPALQWKTIDKATFTIKIPETWNEVSPKYKDLFSQNFKFKNKDTGEYFQIGIDVLIGSETEMPGGNDQYWDIVAKSSGDGVEIKNIEDISDDPNDLYDNPYSTKGNGTFEISTTNQTPIQGHVYYFFFGNSKKETGVDTGIFKEILSSFKAKNNTAEDLRVSISADPIEGTAPLNGVKLKATVSGSAQGTINYTFYCHRSDAKTNITSDWNEKFDGIFDNPKTAVCNYLSPGTYIAKVIAERGSAPPAEARISINVKSKPKPEITRLTIQLVGPFGAPMSGLNGSLMWATQVKEYLYLIDAVGDRVPGGFVGKNDQDYSFTFRTENGVWTFDRDIPAGQYTVIFKGGYSNVVGFSYSNRGISWGDFDKIINVPDSDGNWFIKIIIPEQKSWIRVNLYADVVNQVGTAVNLEGSKLTLIDTNGKLYECQSWSCGTKDGKIKGDFGYLEGGNYTFRIENLGYATFKKVIQVPDVSKIPAYDDQAYEGYGDIELGTIVLTKIQ